MAKLSICIPTYNRSQQLAVTLDSLCRQVEDDTVEIIISDNASEDDTDDVVKNFQKRFSFVKYFKNNMNIGLDDNTLESIKHSSGEYIWLCSDDDIPLPGVLKSIKEVIFKHSPKFIYLRIEGFFDYEPYQIVTERNSDHADSIYQEGEQMFRDHRIAHFSSVIYRRDLFYRYLPFVDEYRARNWGRGYAFVVIANYLILSEPGPFYFIGKICIAVRNISKPDYNSDVLKYVVIDNAKFYQDLRRKGLISRQTELFAINWSIKGLYRLLLPMKCKKDPRYTKSHEYQIIGVYSGYPLFYFRMLPILILPRWTLIIPYLFARLIKRVYFRIFKMTPF